jgi:hypothetical protein
MSSPTPTIHPPAHTHAEAAALFRRPFAPGAIGFRAVMRVPFNGDPLAGAHVAAYIGAQSVLQRLNAVVPGRWRMEFKLLQATSGAKKRYMSCRLLITLPIRERGPDVEAVYEDVGELETGSPAGLKALYSDARKRAGVAAGIGAYLYTALQPVVLPIGPGDRQVQVVQGWGGEDGLALSPATEDWLREGYARQMSTDAVRRGLGEILAHGELEQGAGQGEAAEPPAEAPATTSIDDAGEQSQTTDSAGEQSAPRHNGVVLVDFGGRGPDAA